MVKVIHVMLCVFYHNKKKKKKAQQPLHTSTVCLGSHACFPGELLLFSTLPELCA